MKCRDCGNTAYALGHKTYFCSYCCYVFELSEMKENDICHLPKRKIELHGDLFYISNTVNKENDNNEL